MRGVFIGATLVAVAATAQEAPDAAESVSVELNKLEDIESGCRSFFLFRNRGGRDVAAFELSLAVLDRRGVIDRLLTIDAAPLPADRTTLKIFEIPEMTCDAIGEVIVHEITACDAVEGPPEQCWAAIGFNSLADAKLVK